MTCTNSSQGPRGSGASTAPIPRGLMVICQGCRSPSPVAEVPMAPEPVDDRAGAEPVVPVQRGATNTPVFSSARLRAWRHVRNVPVTRLADEANTSTAYVAECETGLRQPNTA